MPIYLDGLDISDSFSAQFFLRENADKVEVGKIYNRKQLEELGFRRGYDKKWYKNESSQYIARMY